MANLDAFTAERVLNGEAELPELTGFLEALRAPSHSSELLMERDVMAKMMENIKATSTPPVRGRNGKAGRRITRRVAVGAAAAVLSLGGVAAAATGVNPLSPLIGGSPDPSLEVVSETTSSSSTTVPTSLPAATSSSTTASGSSSTSAGGSSSTSAGGSSTTAKSESSATPTSIECVDGNHGKTVSSVAQSGTPGKPETPGANHGSVVREAAKSDCGKDSGTETEDSDDDEPPTTTGAAKSSEAKPSTTSTTSRPAKPEPASNGKGNGNAKGSEK